LVVIQRHDFCVAFDELDNLTFGPVPIVLASRPADEAAVPAVLADQKAHVWIARHLGIAKRA